MPKQQILAPHRHPMDGVVEDIACLPSAPAQQDDLYMIVQRSPAGGPGTRYIEVLTPAFSSVKDVFDASLSWHVDCGLSFHAANSVMTIFGLFHLRGKTVAVIADGAQQTDKIVSATSPYFIQLDRPARNVIVGLPMRSEILDLPRNMSTQEGSTVGRERGVREVNVHLLNCGGGSIGTVTKAGIVLPQERLLDTGDKPMGAPVELFHGLKRITVECEIGEEVRVQIVNDDAMPCQVMGISPYIEIEEI
jgi:hypothetical protein